MATCQITGHPDTYGVGIRTAFYLQWFGVAAASWLLESDALNLKFVNALTVAATSASLAINLDGLQPAETYVVLLLVCGTLYFTVPLYIWRLATCCRPWWDPGRWPRARKGWLFRVSVMLMLGALLGLQLWFWCTGVHIRPATGVVGSRRSSGADCVQYGFLFGQISLDDPVMIAINIIVHLGILVVGTWAFTSYIGLFDECRWQRRRKRRWSISENRAISLQQLRTVCDVSVAATITLAIEFAISWNGIQGVNDLSSAAQLIPLIISGTYLLRSVYVWFSGPEEWSKGNDFPRFPSGSGGSGCHTISGGSGPPRRRSNMAYIGTAGHRRHSSHSRHHRSRRSPRASPTMIDDRPDLIDACPMPRSVPRSMSTASVSLAGSSASGQPYMTPLGVDVVYEDLYHQDHVYDGPAPPMMYPVPPADDFGYLPPEPLPTVASMYGVSRRHSILEESFSPPIGGFDPSSPPPGGFV